MNLEIFAIFDQKAGAYLTPFFLPSKEMAIREVTNCVNDLNHAFGRNPADYTLFHLGTFNSLDAGISPHLPINALGNGLEFKTQTELPDLSNQEWEKRFNELSPEQKTKLIS